jgi:hypothetical protein
MSGRLNYVANPDGSLKTYYRVHAHLLYLNGVPQRIISWEDWLAMRSGSASDGYSVGYAWVLKERKAD